VSLLLLHFERERPVILSAAGAKDPLSTAV